jgi:formylglycine-generating enzyme required for sulfatase activity
MRAAAALSRPARWLAGLLACAAATGAAAAPDYRTIPATGFTSVLAAEADAPAPLAAYALRSEPVTNAEFLAFVQKHPEWQRGEVPGVFADARYLEHWAAPDRLGEGALPDQPVTRVSWFAADAYCQSEQARLPTWQEWERAAAASATVADARGDPTWRRTLLEWYSQPSSRPLGTIGGEPNLYGVRDLHALVWEWVDDFSALIVAPDSRNQGDPDRLKFCGEAALSLRDRDNYALLMRVAMLSSLKAVNTTVNLGFRCARDLPDTAPARPTTRASSP